MTNQPDILRTMIVDDEPLAVERLQLLCAREQGLDLVGTANDGESALRLAEQLKPDLIFLDINMPRLDGMGVARRLGKSADRPAIIFVTAYDSFAVEAFELAAIDYLLKPVALDRMHIALERVRKTRLIGKNGHHQIDETAQSAEESPWIHEFWVPHRNELKRISVDQIDRIEAERDYMRLHVGTRSYLLHETIKQLEARLDPEAFIRLHRSHISRTGHITGLRNGGGGAWYAILADDMELRIGRTYLAQVKKLAGK